MVRAFRKYLLPGFVFQSVVIAGGYGTGRELVEFFLSLGPMRGLFAMLGVAMVIWSAVSAVSFAFAHQFRCYEYRGFFQALLGRGWVLFEVCYVALLFIVLAVIGAAAGAIAAESFRLPYAVGVLVIMGAVGFLVFRGSRTIEGFLALWSFVLYATFVVMVVWSLALYGDRIVATLGAHGGEGGWMVGGVRYAAYNLAVIPPVLFALHHIETRREAVIAGVLAGPIAMFPALFFYLAMAAHYPDIVDRTVPASHVLEALDARWFFVVYQVVLFGTLIETGTGLIHAVNERIAAVYGEAGRRMPAGLRPLVAVLLLAAAALLSSLGLIGLIAKGYGTLTWGFLAVYVIPVLTFGVWKLRAAGTTLR
jgi:uncharacterized membrane protein YkvI